MKYILLLIALDFIVKGYFHFQYLSLKNDEEIIGRNAFFDALMPLADRARYIKIYLSTLMLPIFKKAESDESLRLKKVINYLVLLFYILLAALILLIKLESSPNA